MKCPCQTSMQMLGSVVSADGKLLLSSYRCPRCGKRSSDTGPNPRYVPVVKPEERKENKGARLLRSKHYDEGYVPKVCCCKCGEVMREKTVDGYCHSCAEVMAI